VPENISRSANVSLGNVVAQVKLIRIFTWLIPAFPV
jgi:hypothetical protein